MHYDNFDLAWIAGFFDGEGCITICNQFEKPTQLRPRGRNRQALHVSLAQNNKGILEWVMAIYGGSVHCKNVPNKKNSFVWNVSSRDSQKIFLNAILPFLKLKREQAKLALVYLETVGGFGKGFSILTDDVRNKRQSLLIALKEAKKNLQD